MNCEYGHGECKAPDTQCPYWQGTFCELDKEAEEQEAEREQYLLSPALYQAYVDIVDKFDKEVKEHPEIIEKIVSKYWEQAPTVDAVPVVRCRECKHLNVVNRKELYAHCPKTNTVFLPFELDTREHFCSLGERKEGAD